MNEPRAITPKEARQKALDVLAQADDDLQQERQAEARFNDAICDRQANDEPRDEITVSIRIYCQRHSKLIKIEETFSRKLLAQPDAKEWERFRTVIPQRCEEAIPELLYGS